jgi:hypothetical protein
VFIFSTALLSFVHDANWLLEEVDVRQHPSFDEGSIVWLAPPEFTLGVGSRRSLKSASIAMRVAVSGRLVLPGTLPEIALTTERSQVGITSAPMRQNV